MARRRTRKQRGGGGEQSKDTQAAAAGGGAAAAPAPALAAAEPEEEAIVSIHYLLTLLRGGPIAAEPVYTELVENKRNLTRILDRLEDQEDALNEQLQEIESEVNAERREIQAPLARVRRGSFNQNNVENREAANTRLRRLNASANAETVRRLRREIRTLYTKTIFERQVNIREIESTFFQETLRRLEPLVKLPQYCSDAEREAIGVARNELFTPLRTILYSRGVYALIQAYDQDLNPQAQ